MAVRACQAKASAGLPHLVFPTCCHSCAWHALTQRWCYKNSCTKSGSLFVTVHLTNCLSNNHLHLKLYFAMVALPNPVPLRRHQRLGELDPDTRRWRNVEPAQTPRHPYIKAHPTHLNAGASIKSVLFSGQTVGYVLLPIFGYALGPRATVLLFVSIFVVTAWLYWGASGSEALTEGRHAVTRRHGSKKTSRLRLRISSAPKVEPPPGKTAGNIARHLALGALFALCVSNAGSDPILVILTPLVRHQ
ncbi:hypothetical protein C8Q79DRAFT_758925 [Trametes meyenii]|nr:hypothetical protein C8Q79DRAFT_758925 [Trametes meyenii]